MKKNISKTNTYLLILIFISAAIFALLLWNTICNKSVKLTTDNEILKAKIELLEKHETWTIGVMGIAIAIATVLMGLLQFYFTKKAEDNVFTNLAEIANEDKVAFKEAVKMKSIELELMSEYPIYIISNERTETCNSTKLLSMLREFHFEKVERISYIEAKQSKSKFCEKSVIILCDSEYKSHEFDNYKGEIKLIDERLVYELLSNNPKLGVLGVFNIYDVDFIDIFKDKGCVSFAQFPSQVYNNLMSLLHYKRYLNSTTVKDNTQC